MKTKGRAWHLVVSILLIVAFSITAFTGIKINYGDTVSTYIKGASDIRFGVDIKGGVNVTFTPSDGYDASEEQLDAAQSVIENRLVGLNVTDYEIYIDQNDDSIILEFPWKSDESDFDPEAAIEEIGTTAYLAFREGDSSDGELILDGSMVESASAGYGQTSSSGSDNEFFVSLSFNNEGALAFGEATTKLAEDEGVISIWLDDDCISVATVRTAITDGSAIITGNFDQETAVALARQINSGALPFALSVDSYSTISPTLGENSLRAMVLAGCIAFALIFAIMTFVYRLPGFLASIALLGQVAATLAFVSGYFPVFPSFTLTLPGIAGIILAVGMGVDANVITAERIREELHSGKSLDGALKAGFQRGLAPIIDGNITIIIVSAVLMGAFGPTDGFFAKLFAPVFFAFGASTAGTIYAFGYTLLTGVILNFVFGVFFSRIMIRGAAAIKYLRKPWLFGAPKNGVAAEPKKFDLVKNKNLIIRISAGIISTIVLCAFVFGVRLDTKFTGGAIISLSYDGEIIVEDIQKDISEALEASVSIQTGNNIATGDKTITIAMPGTETVTIDRVEEMVSVLDENYQDNHFKQLSLSNVSPTMGAKFLGKSFVAVLVAMALILVYIAVRFRNIGGWTGGLMAIFALLNDLMIVFGAFVLMLTPLDGNFIAVLLTILGYSINDTVVVYDRIRENRELAGKKESFDDLVNESVNQSIRRTAMTTITTIVSLSVLSIICLLYGLTSLISFVFPLMLGMLSGVFTSLCVATSGWLVWLGKKR